ncbi:beta galactosidase jelly roll domain-containing protein [candidate division KSB1 bacterium]|nr:beta galactosidase jelly roll domain-containing protein [candidate division KSB1 bacterium]
MNTIFIVLFLLLSITLVAEVRLPRVFSSHMVLQQDRDIPVWGWAEPGEQVTVKLFDQKKSTTADEEGTWRVTLSKMEAGGPYQMIVEDSSVVLFDDVLIGEVWICSGQSNMEWPLSMVNNADEEMAAADYPNMRLFQVSNRIGGKPETDLPSGAWAVCTPETAPEFSAVGYFFGRDLLKTQNVPVGLISSNWGGTDIETWISQEAIQTHLDFEAPDEAMGKMSMQEIMEKADEEYEAWLVSIRENDLGMKEGSPIWADPDLDASEWPIMSLPSLWEGSGLPGLDGVVWFRKTFDLTDPEAKSDLHLSLGPIDDSDETFVNGKKVGEMWDQYNVPRKYTVPSDVLQSGTNTLAVRVEDYTGGGGLWGKPEQLFIQTMTEERTLVGDWQYQVGSGSESRRPRQPGPNSYPSLLFNGMINPLIPYAMQGVIWYQGENNAGRAYQYRDLHPLMIKDWRNRWDDDFPFLLVQLANYMAAQDAPAESDWAELREAQLMTLSEKKTGMAVTIDVGEAQDIHPRNKQDVGHRLALAARKIAYGEDIVHSGPIYDSMKKKKDHIQLKFKHAGSGLEVKDRYGYLKGFAIAGLDSVFHWAKAEIDGKDKVKVWNPKIEKPIAVRYGWAANPDDVNLYNKEGLPASPFRTDDWPGVTQKAK